MKSARARKIAGLAALPVALLVGLRIFVSVPIEGDWVGTMTMCACNHVNLMRFHGGQITWYGHGGEPDLPTDWGTYRKIGRNTFEWASRKYPATIVKSGWLLSSYRGGPLQGVHYCWRYPWSWRANKLFKQCEQMRRTEPKRL
jgi:hypothetical protein